MYDILVKLSLTIGLLSKALAALPPTEITIKTPPDVVVFQTTDITQTTEKRATEPIRGQKLALDERVWTLINCESGWKNTKILDVNNKMSYGIAMYQSSTWNAFSKESGITGNPMIPNDAIAMTYWALQNGKEGHWRNCVNKYNLWQ